MKSVSANWFEVAICYSKPKEDGTDKMVTERYGVDALSFTEAESRIVEEMEANITGEFKITSESQANYNEVVFSDDSEDEYWFKCKLQFITINESNGKEKYSNINYLVQAKSVAKALDNITEMMRGAMTDYNVVSISATKLIDVFEYKTKEKK